MVLLTWNCGVSVSPHTQSLPHQLSRSVCVPIGEDRVHEDPFLVFGAEQGASEHNVDLKVLQSRVLQEQFGPKDIRSCQIAISELLSERC